MAFDINSTAQATSSLQTPAESGLLQLYTNKLQGSPIVSSKNAKDIAAKSFNFQNTLYNNTEYVVKYGFCNSTPDGDVSNIFNINNKSILSLSITDNMGNWYTTGEALITSQFGGLEAAPLSPLTPPSVYSSLLTENKPSAFVFSNDGWDIMRIYIVPKGSDLNPDEWVLSKEYCICKIEDLTLPVDVVGNAQQSQKVKKLYLVDSFFQQLSYKNGFYSSALSPTAQPDSLYSAKTGGSLDKSTEFTGSIIKEIIKDKIKVFSVDPKGPVNMFYDDNKKNPWDKGGCPIFYTSSMNSTFASIIDDVYLHHISEKQFGNINDICFLKVYTDEAHPIGYFSLTPLSEYFSRAGSDLYKEIFYLSEFLDLGQDGTPLIKKGPAPSSTTVNHPLNSIIHKYEYVDIESVANQEYFRQRIVHSFDFSQRKMRVEFEKNNPTDARKFIADNYISKLHTENQSSKESLFLININKHKAERKAVLPIYSLIGREGSIYRSAQSSAALLKVGLFQNTCVRFTLNGMTNRNPGTFFNIEQSRNDNSELGDKLYGQWLCMQVVHLIDGNRYYNEITAIKVHRFKQSNYSHEGMA